MGLLTRLFTYQKSLNRDRILCGGLKDKKPFLCFDYTVTTNQFHTSTYRKPLSKDRIRLHKEIMKLHDKGWGYTKIHRHLLKNGFEIGKSRTTVDSIIKKIKKREEFLSNNKKGRFGSFRVEVRKF